MSSVLRHPLRQRADYTHKYNTNTGRHGWLRLTPAYSLKVVEEIIEHFDDEQLILDPFCGTGTTALSAAYHGHRSITTDINPFLVWFASAKVRNYSNHTINLARTCAREIIMQIAKGGLEPTEGPPPIHNIDRWWSKESVDLLLKIRTGISQRASNDPNVRDLLLIAFCRAVIERSNAAFNHQSMSFKAASAATHPLEQMCDAFLKDVDFVLEGAADNPEGLARVIHCDSRSLHETNIQNVSTVITSPPYANRMSYIRELRPYMYWLGHLGNPRDAGELDWLAIGGTWGIATSRLSTWKRREGYFRSASLDDAISRIASTENKSGPVLAQYVTKYFDDMWDHFKSLTSLLATGAKVHYIVGNSTFYGNLVSTELLYAEMLDALGFVDVRCKPIRKRNSKKELVEFDVSATWPGQQ